LHFDGGGRTFACLQSIAAGTAGVRLGRVAVVDNASTDESMALAEGVALPLTLVRNATNEGFGVACNQGAAGSAADYLLFLNPDTRLEPDTLARTLAFLEAPEQRTVGICGIRLLDDDGHASTSAARFPSPRIFFGEATGLGRVLPGLFPRHLLTAGDCATTRDVDQVIGAYFVVRRSLFEALGGFDPRFFVYFEEVDVSLRAKLAGYRSVYFAGATAHHTGGLSSDQVKARRLFYTLRGRLLYASMHFSALRRWLVMAITFGIEWPMRTLRARLQGGTAPAETATAFARLREFVARPDWATNRAWQRQP
jgi:GT2 family glycosyltransferase